MAAADDKRFIYWFSELGIADVPKVGGKNASLGEMFANLTDKGVQVPDGYAISAHAYWHFVTTTGLKEQIRETLTGLDTSNTRELAKRGESIRTLIQGTPLPDDLTAAITGAYDELCRRYGVEVDTAVRSSATAEDLPDASFAGQQDTYLNIRGHEVLLKACRDCFASLFTDRAIAYRQERDFDHFAVALSIGVQKMVRSDLAAAGVMFSLDTESGFKDAVFVTSGYGLGENVVQGAINPDEWYVHKPTLKAGHKPIVYAHVGEKQQKMIYTEGGDDGEKTKNVPVPPEEAARFSLSEDEVLQLARWAVTIEEHYSEEAGAYKPMDVEWAKDGQTGELFVVQARPETVVSRRESGVLVRTVLEKTGPVLAEGQAVGDRVGAGKAMVIQSSEGIHDFKPGMVLVTTMTDPDWVPVMKIASAIVTDFGGRTCHAAIVSRELGIPCVVGTGTGSQTVPDGEEITVSCAAGGTGYIYKGLLPYKEETIRLDELTMPSVPLAYHQAYPGRAFTDARYPHQGVGLVRVDELIRNEVRAHPLACLNYPDERAAEVDAVSVGYPDKKDFFVRRLSQAVGHIAAAEWPGLARVLLSDAPWPEMGRLAGGKAYAHTFEDANPVLGARGVGRYQDFEYEEAFELELAALRRVREEMGLTNVALVLPGCRTARELKALAGLLAGAGLGRSGEGPEHHLLCRLPAQLLSLDSFADAVDGFLIHLRDVAQLVLGADPASMQMNEFFDELHPAVVSLVDTALEEAKRLGKPAALTGVSTSKLTALAKTGLLGKASALVLAPEVFAQARENLLEAEGKPIH